MNRSIERLRLWVALRLDDLYPGVCRTDLITWAIYGNEFPDLRRFGATCDADVRECGECYCGKRQIADAAALPLFAPPAADGARWRATGEREA